MIPVTFEQSVETVDVADPNARATMDELREVLERGAAKLNEMLPLEVSLSALAGDGGNPPRAMFRKRRARLGFEEPVVSCLIATGNDTNPVAEQVQGAGEADRVGRHGVGPCLVEDVARGADLHGYPQRELLG